METYHRPHHGRNLKRFREILGIKQEVIAYQLGDDWDQKKISRLEEKEIIEDELMEQIAAILKVPADAIRNFDEDKIVQIISNTFRDQSFLVGYAGINAPTFNPLDKLLEQVEKNEKLYNQLLAEKDKRNSLMEELLKQK